MKIHCLYDKLVKPKDLLVHPKNRNKHPKEQIDRLAKVLKYQGWRYPIKVSKRSGFITSGHGRLEAARANGWKEVPVNYQEYDTDEQEYADLVADNAVALWAEIDLGGINSDIADFGPELDIEMLGIKNFTVDASERVNPFNEWQGMPEFEHEDQTAFRSIKINFANNEHVRQFSELIKQTITDKTRSVWYPAAEIGSYADKRYQSDISNNES